MRLFVHGIRRSCLPEKREITILSVLIALIRFWPQSSVHIIQQDVDLDCNSNGIALAVNWIEKETSFVWIQFGRYKTD